MDEQPTKSSEEIDLIYFLRPIGNLIKKIYNLLSDYVAMLANNKFFFFIIVVLITGGGYLLRYYVTPGYTTQGVFISHVLPGKYFSAISKDLQELVEEPDRALLANQLKVSRELANNIRSINILPDHDTFAMNKRDTVALLFTVELGIYDMSKVDSLQDALVNYFENTDYANRRKEAKIKTLLALKTSLQQKMFSLDSLKTIVNNSITPRSQGQGIILGEPIDPVAVYRASTDNYKELLRIDEQLTLINNIEVLQPFMKLDKYNYPKFNRMLAYAFLASIFAALILVPMFGKRLKISRS